MLTLLRSNLNQLVNPNVQAMLEQIIINPIETARDKKTPITESEVTCIGSTLGG